MSDVTDLTNRIISFRNARDWKRFHTSKDVALSLVLEATEVMEHFQWKTEKESSSYIKENKKAIAEELADVMYWVLLMSYDLGINISEELEEKMKQNEKKYPVEKAKGKHTKYTEL